MAISLFLGACGGAVENGSEATRGKSDTAAVSGPWQIPADVLARGDAQRVTYTGASSCVGGVTEGGRLLKAQLQQRFPQITEVLDYSCRQIVGGSSLSVHSAGRALDLMIPLASGDANNAAGDPIGAWLIENAESIGIQYIIWDRLSWNASRAAGSKARAYGGGNKSPHTDHLHIELSVEAGNAATPFFNGGATTPVTAPTQPQPTEPSPTRDGVAPSVRILSPSNGARFTADGQVGVVVDATDNVGVTRVDLRVNGDVVDSRAAAPYQFTLRLAAGQTSVLTAVAHDAAGLSAETSVQVEVEGGGTVNPNPPTPPQPQPQPQGIAPTVRIVSPTQGAVLGAAEVTVVTEAYDDLAVTRLDLLANGALVASRGDLPYNLTATLAPGPYTLTVVVHDAEGNSGRDEIAVTVAPGAAGPASGADAQPPTVRITAPQNGAAGQPATTVIAEVTDDQGIASVSLKVNDAVLGTLGSQPGPYRFDVTLPAGLVTLVVEATDLAGNVGTAVVQVTVSEPGYAPPSAPAPAPISPDPRYQGDATGAASCALGGEPSPPPLTLLLACGALALARRRRRSPR